MADAPVRTSPQVYARIGGVLYLVIIAAGIFGELFVRGAFIVSGRRDSHRQLLSQNLDERRRV